MNTQKDTLEQELVCEAIANGALLSFNELTGFQEMQRVVTFAHSLTRAAVKYGILPDELKPRSSVAAEMKEQSEKDALQRKKDEVDALKKEVAQLQSEVDGVKS